MADADGDDAAEEVEKLVSVRVPDELVLCAFDYQRLVEVVKDGGEQIFPLCQEYFVSRHDARPQSSYQSRAVALRILNL
jgi:hypothetical protein